jgi:hypothetical protein
MATTYEAVFPLLERTASPADQWHDVPRRAIGCRAFVQITDDPAAASITVTLSTRERITGIEKALLTSAALASVSDTVLEVWPGATAVADEVASAPLGGQLVVAVAHADSDAITYQIVVEFF